VAEILRVAGYRVREAGDGESALDQLARHRVGVVVLDLRMPERDGMGVLAAVGAHAPPVVLVSGYPLAGDAGVHTDPHVFMVLQKPFKPVALLDAVAGAMGLPVTA
jgi:DNA-binding NtrC family response regulator